MILEYKVNEIHVEPAWLKTLYDLIEELNCKCKTYIDETYNRTYKQFSRTRIIEVYGSDTMLSWLKLRMERYNHFIDALNERPEIQASMKEENEEQMEYAQDKSVSIYEALFDLQFTMYNLQFGCAVIPHGKL